MSTDTALLEGAIGLLELRDRTELQHVLACGDCYVFDSYDGGGPHWCSAFRIEFRGWLPGKTGIASPIPPLWSKAIAAALAAGPDLRQQILAMRLPARPDPVITAGEPEGGAWCPVCLEPWRLRIPLMLDGEPAAILEICPGCGTGHDKSAAYITPGVSPADYALSLASAPWPVRTVAWLRLRAALRSHRAPEDQCASGTCTRRARDRHQIEMPGEDGTWRYRFCSGRCQRAWAAENGMHAA